MNDTLSPSAAAGGAMATEGGDLAAAIDERDRILVAFDIDAAKAFVAKHGGKAPERVNWTMVLHLARLECESIRESHDDLWWDSRVWLARNGAVTVVTHRTREVAIALNLIFPKDLTAAVIAAMEAPR